MTIPGVADIYVAGVSRCGTTWCHGALAKHPQVDASMVKEPMFFGADLQQLRASRLSVNDLDEYLGLFRGGPATTVRMEASPLYLYSHVALTEIDAANPTARVIVMFRDPVERIDSHHRLRLANGVEPDTDLTDALRNERSRLGEPARPIGPHRGHPYIGMSRYAEQLERAFATLGRDRVHVVIYDDLRDDPARVYKEIVDFCDLEPFVPPDVSRPTNSHRHSRSPRFGRFLRFAPPGARRVVRTAVPARRARVWLKRTLFEANIARVPRPPVDPTIRAQICATLAPEIERLSVLLDRDLTHWMRDA